MLAAVAAISALYLPAAQIPQSVSASWAVAALAASVRYVPAGQSEHELTAGSGLYLPAPQTTHVLAAVAPVVALYFPASQTTQSAISSCKDANDAASTRYLPASQDVQADKEVVLYLPAEHTEQVYEKGDPETVP